MCLVLSYIQAFHIGTPYPIYRLINLEFQFLERQQSKKMCLIYTFLFRNNIFKHKKKVDSFRKSSILNSHGCNIK